MKTRILSWLLFHANRFTKSEAFYAIKNRLLKKHGRFILHDVQYLEGKACWSCNGTGIHHYTYDQYGFRDEPIECFKCFGSGWYKYPVWVILERIRFGKFFFHQPIGRSYNEPLLPVSIDGYVNHEQTKHGKFALAILYLLYDRQQFKRFCRMEYKKVLRKIKRAQMRRRVQKIYPERKMLKNHKFVTEDDRPF